MEKRFKDTKSSGKIAVWSERIATCRSSGISTISYYKWQKKLFCLAAQYTPQFAEMCCASSPNFGHRASRKCFKRYSFGCGYLNNSHAAANPAVMLNDFTRVNKVYIAYSYTEIFSI